MTATYSGIIVVCTNTTVLQYKKWSIAKLLEPRRNDWPLSDRGILVDTQTIYKTPWATRVYKRRSSRTVPREIALQDCQELITTMAHRTGSLLVSIIIITITTTSPIRLNHQWPTHHLLVQQCPPIFHPLWLFRRALCQYCLLPALLCHQPQPTTQFPSFSTSWQRC